MCERQEPWASQGPSVCVHVPSFIFLRVFVDVCCVFSVFIVLILLCVLMCVDIIVLMCVVCLSVCIVLILRSIPMKMGALS